MKAALVVLVALISCAPVSYADPVKFSSSAELGTWLASNGFSCVPALDFQLCSYQEKAHSWQFQVVNADTTAKRKASCDGGTALSQSHLQGDTWALFSGKGDAALSGMLETVKSKGLTDGKIVTACPYS
ncbi:MAG: hypothetical protein ACRDUS_14410 [Mycobacterium sp.]